ncbi:MAG: hypothetical protein MI739_07955 [Bacteroidales bacterium]|nr:hypothetical protein [Bacteroidales bacterium]
MKSKYFSILKAILTIVFVSGIVLFYQQHISDYKIKLMIKERDLNREKEKNTDILSLFKQHINYSYLNLKNFELTNSENKLCKLATQIKNKTLCMYFTEQMCGTCTSYQINKFKEFEKKYGTDKLIILTSLHNRDKLKYLNKIYQTKIPFYEINEKSLLPATQNSPFVFILDKNLTLSSLYFIESNFSELNNIYFDTIEAFLNK